MFCSKCNCEISDSSRFCNFCGMVVGINSSAPESVVAILRPSFIFVGLRYVVASVIVLILMVVGATAISWWGENLYILLGIIILSLLVFINPIYYHVLQYLETYTLTTEKVQIQTGFFHHTIRNIPLNKIQDITINTTLVKRLLKIGDIAIDSASESGKIFLRNINNPQSFSSLLLKKINR